MSMQNNLLKILAAACFAALCMCGCGGGSVGTGGTGSRIFKGTLEENGTYAVGVEVTINGGEASTVTDASGQFILEIPERSDDAEFQFEVGGTTKSVDLTGIPADATQVIMLCSYSTDGSGLMVNSVQYLTSN